MAKGKKKLRETMRRVRDQAHKQSGEMAAKQLKQMAGHINLGSEDLVFAAYIPQQSEIDPRPLLGELISLKGEQETALAMPVIEAPGKPLQFRRWRPGDMLGSGHFGMLEPMDHQAELIPDLLLVPLLAFDLDGRRLGQGGGFYDRTLAKLRSQKTIQAIGVAFDCQQRETLPIEDHDQPLDGILTPTRCLSWQR